MEQAYEVKCFDLSPIYKWLCNLKDEFCDKMKFPFLKWIIKLCFIPLQYLVLSLAIYHFFKHLDHFLLVRKFYESQKLGLKKFLSQTCNL